MEGSDWVKEGNWRGWGAVVVGGGDVEEKRVGIVGMGRMGRGVGKGGGGFEMKVVYHN
uniref:NAD(P)-dependent oxidoreductase n=1 Tax=Bacillus pumilus TaxID=1408 RepID=UPI003704A9E0